MFHPSKAKTNSKTKSWMREKHQKQQVGFFGLDDFILVIKSRNGIVQIWLLAVSRLIPTVSRLIPADSRPSFFGVKNHFCPNWINDKLKNCPNEVIETRCLANTVGLFSSFFHLLVPTRVSRIQQELRIISHKSLLSI